MPITNPKNILDAGTAIPAAIESKLPAGAPSLSSRLLDLDNHLPALPDFPIALPDLPPLPSLPNLPTPPSLPGAGTQTSMRYVNMAAIKSLPGSTVGPVAINPPNVSGAKRIGPY